MQRLGRAREPVSFSSLEFALLFAAVLLLRATVFRRARSPAYLLLIVVASTLFYCWHVPEYLALIVASTLIDYGACALLTRLPDEATRRRRAVLVVSLAGNLGLLGYFKYAGFFLDNLRAAFPSLAGVDAVEVVLPIGISFYTFQSMSCTIDVYRRRMAPPRSLLHFYLFVSFFPQLVAGPIVRARDFLYQIGRARSLNALSAGEGLWLMLQGYFLKTVCGDGVGRLLERHWHLCSHPEAAALDLLLLALAFHAMAFCDFCGYSRIARGAAYLLGFRLPVNFRLPYAAATVSGFWRDWHITMSGWFRDYVYIPLGGNRYGPARTMLHLLFVMTLVGLWHGAAWTYVVFGALHGAMLVIERAVGVSHPGDPGTSGAARWRRLAWTPVAHVFVLLCWFVFRSDTLGQAWSAIARLGGAITGATPIWLGQATAHPVLADLVRGIGTTPLARALPALVMALPFLAVAAMHAHGVLVRDGYLRPLGARGRALVGGFMLFALLSMYNAPSPFLYFQF